MPTSPAFVWFVSLRMKRFQFLLLCLTILVPSGCYDPTDATVTVTGAAPKQNQVAIDEADRELELTADNTDIKWTGSNAAGQTPYGYFYELSGKAVLDGDSETLKAVVVLIQMDSVKAMNPSLTEKLKKHGFFEVEKFGTSRFHSTSISRGGRPDDPDGTTHVIEGNFQLRDVTRSIKIPVAISIGPTKFGLTSEFSINRKDYGVVYANAVEDAAIRNGVVINLEVEVDR